MNIYEIRRIAEWTESETTRLCHNIWIEYVYGYITANKAIELLEGLWNELAM